MTDRIRTTISLKPEVLEVFRRMAEAGNMSVSRAMGEWLDDTADAAQMIVLKMEEAKKAPMRVMKELQSMVAEMSSQVDTDMERVRQMQRPPAARARGSAAVGAPLEAPSSNTGLNTPPKGKGRGRRL